MSAKCRALAVLVVPICFILVLGTLLAGCGPEDGGGGNAPDPTTAAPSPTAADPQYSYCL
jgi:hypothetical protein